MAPSLLFPQNEQAWFHTHYFSEPGLAETAFERAGMRQIIEAMPRLVPDLRGSQVIAGAGHWLPREASWVDALRLDPPAA